MGLCPKPHFILCLDAKNEARKIKPKRPPTRSAAMQEFQAKLASLLAEIPCIAAFTASTAPHFGTANARFVALTSPQCVRSKNKFLFQTVCRSNEGDSRSAFKPSVFFGYFL